MASVTVFDVAKYILEKQGDMSAMKLQKVVYYSQAWSLVWDDIDEVFSFHLKGKSRIFCIRDRHIAKLLWYDPEHLVCPSKLKHT